jgi:hypothetical protein
MARPVIEPVTDANLAEFAEFLNRHLFQARSPAQWEEALKVDFGLERPNYGFLMRDAGAIVGGIGAIYAAREIGGRQLRFCNITSWCVLDDYRKQSMRLAMAVTGQPGYCFTDFSPTALVGGVLRFLKFRPLDERQTVILNLPLPAPGTRLLHRAADIEAALSGLALRIYRDHARFPWLEHVVLGTGGGAWCHVIYKRREFKGLPSAHVLHVSDRPLFARALRRFCSHLLARGMVSTHVENRDLARGVWASRVRSGFNAKLFLDESLEPDQIDYLYSETMSMDL